MIHDKQLCWVKTAKAKQKVQGLYVWKGKVAWTTGSYHFNRYIQVTV